MKFFVQVFFLWGVVASSFAGIVELYFQQVKGPPISLIRDSNIQTEFFPQLIDHSNIARGVFAQRFHYDETYGPDPDAPVFFYICGEAACEPGVVNLAIRHYAKKFHAKIVALEHRYYGMSQPFEKLSSKNLKYLTVHEALEDLSNFQKKISVVKNWRGKWVSFGGSYPGSLSAYYRLKYPENVIGALASSAPVMAKEDFQEYDQHVTKITGNACAAKMRDVVREIEEVILQDNQEELTRIKQLFTAEKVENNVDFLYLIADIGAAAVQYGMHDDFCDALQTDASPMQGYAKFTQDILRLFKKTAVEMTPQGALNEDSHDPSNASQIGMRQWYYQSCTEFGYWQNAAQEPERSSRSSLINLDYHREVCKRLFGLKRPAAIEATNKEYYTRLFFPDLASRIYFTNGAYDPWSKLSMTEKNGNTYNSYLYYTLIEGAAHCDDLRAVTPHDSDALQSARRTFETLLEEWLA